MALAIYIVIDNYLSLDHLQLQIEALNAQTQADFQVVYLNQRRSKTACRALTLKAKFKHQIYDIPYPYLNGVCCWELVNVMGNLLNSCPAEYMTYLHQECLPATRFVEELLKGIKAVETHTKSQDQIYILNQLRCTQTASDLSHQGVAALDPAQAVSWVHHRQHAPQGIFQAQNWEEDAFALPVALAKKLKLFSCVSYPLYFLDLFDLLFQLEDKPYCADISYYRLQQPVIYHLNHGRSFLEYSQRFLDQVKQRPDLFGHLALYELAHSKFDYSEPFEGGQRRIRSDLHAFVQYMKYSSKGSVSLWSKALDQANLTSKQN